MSFLDRLRAPYDIYMRSLYGLGLGFPLWVPEPEPPFGEVCLGDVGYISQGRFCLLFNTMRAPTDNQPHGVPPDFVRFEPPPNTISTHIDAVTQKMILSRGLVVASTNGGANDESQTHSSPAAETGVTFRCNRKSGALLMLQGTGDKTRLVCNEVVAKYIKRFIRSWHKFANDAETVDIDLDLSDIVFVNGFTKVSAWGVAAFESAAPGGLFEIRRGETMPSGAQQLRGLVGWDHEFESVLSFKWGPSYRVSGPRDDAGSIEPIPKDQCIFLQYMRVRYNRVPLWLQPIMRAGAGPHNLPPPDDETPCSPSVLSGDVSSVSPDADLACTDRSLDVYEVGAESKRTRPWNWVPMKDQLVLGTLRSMLHVELKKYLFQPGGSVLCHRAEDGGSVYRLSWNAPSVDRAASGPTRFLQLQPCSTAA
ncbi:hypothetical protein L226DRAFT_529054 [Lentinus tigrinus ALCF2SS1-7]|uniref:Uncharacterized protein n=1 Tax=Lentinus tigrinus ALCF2SS1-6 TaxID=1328759 RepID=A0A5C2SLM1_9APHY|nr:hypothetical protein L227DRAFT_571038 [Lentinus tigrinus ALCF2SS1-6]RPD82935.1 hypothetical protein L226DRAFT_529054 [Lentinus tigrinus ALCF2SS1-7]